MPSTRNRNLAEAETRFSIRCTPSPGLASSNSISPSRGVDGRVRGSERSPQRNSQDPGERPLLARARDSSLIELELEPEVSTERELLSQRRREAVRVAPVGRVPSQAEIRTRHPELSLPIVGQGALPTPLRIVKDPDLEVALGASPDGSEAVHREMQDSCVLRSDRRPDAIPVRAMMAGEQHLPAFPWQGPGDLGEDRRVVRRAVQIDEQAGRGAGDERRIQGPGQAPGHCERARVPAPLGSE
jgi:hypothetical protein